MNDVQQGVESEVNRTAVLRIVPSDSRRRDGSVARTASSRSNLGMGAVARGRRGSLLGGYRVRAVPSQSVVRATSKFTPDDVLRNRQRSLTERHPSLITGHPLQRIRAMSDPKSKEERRHVVAQPSPKREPILQPKLSARMERRPSVDLATLAAAFIQLAQQESPRPTASGTTGGREDEVA